MRRAAAVALAALAFAGCGSSSSQTQSTATNSVAGATSAATVLKFALHAGLAVGAFHHWVYKPFQAGDFTGGQLSSHKLAAVKAALAGAFAYREARFAIDAARTSPTLSKLVGPVSTLGATLALIAARLKAGSADTAQIEQAQTQAAAVTGAAAQAGAPLQERAPSALQLATG
jgi:hypothetical protein